MLKVSVLNQGNQLSVSTNKTSLFLDDFSCLDNEFLSWNESVRSTIMLALNLCCTITLKIKPYFSWRFYWIAPLLMKKYNHCYCNELWNFVFFASMLLVILFQSGFHIFKQLMKDTIPMITQNLFQANTIVQEFTRTGGTILDAGRN